MSELAVGDPLDEGTYIGPLTTESGRDELAGLVDDARGKGAEMLVGGRSPSARDGSSRRPWSPV